MRVKKRGAAGGKFVDVRGLRHRVAAEVADPVILVVDGDEEDVRLAGLRRLGLEQAEGAEDGEVAFHFSAFFGFLPVPLGFCLPSSSGL